MTFHQLVAIYNHETDDQGNLVPWYVDQPRETVDPWRGTGLSHEQIELIKKDKLEANAYFLKINNEMGHAINQEVEMYKETLVGNVNAEKMCWAYREEVEEKHIADVHRKFADFKREQLRRRNAQ